MADRLRLPRNALGACPSAARRCADLPGADARRDRHRQPDGLPTAVHPRCRLRSHSSRSTFASWLWFGAPGACVLAALWIVGVRDWRCHALAVTSPVVVHGLYYGNLTILLLCRWPSRGDTGTGPGGGLAVGVAVAAKLFVWPLVVWLLLTRRFRAAVWAIASAVVLVLGPGPLIGFEGFADYPALLRAVQDVYAIRSVSLSTVAGALGASSRSGRRRRGRRRRVPRSRRWVVAARGRRPPGVRAGRRRVYPRITDRLAELRGAAVRSDRDHVATACSAWFFGYAVWLVGAIAPKPTVVGDVCCRPDGVTPMAWSRATASRSRGLRPG